MKLTVTPETRPTGPKLSRSRPMTAPTLSWAWVLGPLGGLLAIPVTLLLKAIFVDSDPRAGWVEALLGSEPSPPKEPKPAETHAGNAHVQVSKEALTPPQA